MFQISEIKDQATGLVGWRQPTESGSPTLDADNIASRSGLIYQEGSGLVRVENIYNTVEDPNLNDANFNTRLKDITGNAFIELLNKIFTQDDYVQNDILFRNQNSWDESITLNTGFVGYEFEIENCRNISMIIDRIAVEFDGDQDVKILIFNDQKRTPVYNTTISGLQDTSVWKDISQVLSNYSSSSNVWYIGYLTSGLSKSPYNRNYDRSNCQTQITGANINPIFVDGWDTETMFNPRDVQYQSETYGLNFEISMYKDFTSLIKTNENRFSKGLQLQVAINVLDMIANTTRSNRNERLSKANAVFEINGNRTNKEYPEHTGLNARLAKEVMKLRTTYNGHGINRGTL